MEKTFLSLNLVNPKENCNFAKNSNIGHMDYKELEEQLEESSSTKSKLIVLFHYLMKEKKNGLYEYVSNEDVGQLYEKLCQYKEKESDRNKQLSDKSYHQSLKDAKKALCKLLEKEYGEDNAVKKKALL